MIQEYRGWRTRIIYISGKQTFVNRVYTVLKNQTNENLISFKQKGKSQSFWKEFIKGHILGT